MDRPAPERLGVPQARGIGEWGGFESIVRVPGYVMARQIDRLGIVIAALLAVAATATPLAVFRANRIVAGQVRSIFESLPLAAALGLSAALLVAALVAMWGRSDRLRLAVAVMALLVLIIAIGVAAGHLAPPGNRWVRVSPGAGFWIAVFALGIFFADSSVRLALGPLARLAAVALSAAVIAALLLSGLWDHLSILMEYASRADVFWREAGAHIMLALGSLVLAVLVGLPLGILAKRVPGLRGPVLNMLNMVQTIPSIALFGILIAPLGWIAAHVPGAAAIGIRGIGVAPAFVALFLYSLLPMVANTVVGLSHVPREAVDAARGMGMTGRQRLLRVELPLALPVILAGVRIVLVQNIGLATIAALIGGGGFGVFVFQGVGQTASDLILLGAVPTVALAFASAVVLDAVTELSSRVRT
ncbi:MAG: ABC transporter permease [Azospirillaceae bacterium]|nr:ABC transporter permease [Azospirillaceae bacterium]